MEFTYDAYRNLLQLLKGKGYTFGDYHTYAEAERCVILRHDIDQSPMAALKMAQLEVEEGARSTYFLLLRTDFYNPATQRTGETMRKIYEMGHEIGLHFDEVAYGGGLTSEETIQRIKKEAAILSSLLETPITTVSMHRPSKNTLNADLQIPGMINSYGKTFFCDFKYLSDSRRNWREPVLDIVRSGEYDRLHILTHAFWYHDQEKSLYESVRDFISDANRERYVQMTENIRDLASVLREDEV